MPATLPDGEVVPATGVLPEELRETVAGRPLSVYVHVPFCASRCGYCDFNTYTASELAGPSTMSGLQETYADTAVGEIRAAGAQLTGAPPVSTVFFGGGTPTLLPAADLVRLLAAVRSEWGLADDAEVTTEANPESVDERYLAKLREGGFTRVSFGMQSSSSRVLALLDRRHTPGAALRAVSHAHAAGFEHVNLDLIYGTPGESDADWRASLEAAVSAGPDHVSAYALIVEDGTRLATRVRRGELAGPDDDVLADRYLMTEELLTAQGFDWYEVSNWARDRSAVCQHNLAYWRGTNWWGVGPGAHSHVSDGRTSVRWWNVKHPRTYAARLAEGASPAAAREVLTDDEARVEQVLLRVRLAEGCPTALLRPDGRAAADRAAARGLVEQSALTDGQIVLTLPGRLLADAVIRDLVD